MIAVGTTTLRALETAAAQDFRAGRGETGFSSCPGYRFSVVDRLVTNFHLPKSTLLMLVAAFAGIEPTSAARTLTPSPSDIASTATETPC